jgi:fructosamine-3-kinase
MFGYPSPERSGTLTRPGIFWMPAHDVMNSTCKQVQALLHQMSNAIPKIILQELQKLEPGAEFTGHLPQLRSSSGKLYFAKSGQPREEEQYFGEAASLKDMEIAAPGLAPRVLASGSDGGRPYLITEYKELASLTDTAAKRLAQRLASELHQYKGLNGFGFQVPTYCGATRLENGWFDSWEECFSGLIGDLLAQLTKKGGYASLCAKGEEIRKTCVSTCKSTLCCL